MDTRAPYRHDLQKQQVRDLLDHYLMHPSVSGYDMRFDETQYGDDRVRVMLYQPGDDRGTDDEIRELLKFERDLSSAISDIIPERQVYVHFVVPPPDGTRHP